MQPALLACVLASAPAFAGAGPADPVKAAEARGLVSFRSHQPGQAYADQAAGQVPGTGEAVERLRRLLGDAREVQEGCALPCADVAETRLYIEKIRVVAKEWVLTDGELRAVEEHYAPAGVPRKRSVALAVASAPSRLEAEAMRRLLAQQSLPAGVRESLTGRVGKWARLLEQDKGSGDLGGPAGGGVRGGAGRSVGREQLLALSRSLTQTPRSDSKYLATLRTSAPPSVGGGATGKPAATAAPGGSAPAGAGTEGAAAQLAPGEVHPVADPGFWSRLKDAVKNPMSDAYGVTVRTGSRDRAFRKVSDAEAFLRTLPGGSVEKLTYYGHGAPGMMSIGAATVDAGSAVQSAKGKVRAGGMVDYIGCNTASVGTETRINPAYGLSTLTRRILYFSVPYLSDKASGGGGPAMKEEMEQMWDEDLARQTSVRLKGVYVCGYRTFGLVGDRLPVVGTLMGRREATSSSAVAGVKACYLDGREVER